MTYVGIDPGLTGAIALINDGSGLLIVDIPTKEKTKLQKLTSSKENIDIGALRNVFEHIVLSEEKNPHDVHVVVERQLAMPNQSASATGKTMMNYGILLGIMNALYIPYTEVEPNVWKKAMLWRRTTLMSKPKKSDLKATSIEQALAMFPGASARINRAGHHNRAEALLLAGYCRKNYNTLKILEGK